MVNCKKCKFYEEYYDIDADEMFPFCNFDDCWMDPLQIDDDLPCDAYVNIHDDKTN